MKRRVRLLKPPVGLTTQDADGKKWTVWFRDVNDRRGLELPDGDHMDPDDMVPFEDVPRCYGCRGVFAPGDYLFAQGFTGAGPLAWHLRCKPEDDELEALGSFLRLIGVA